MLVTTNWEDVESRARELAGNHYKFNCFAYYDRPVDGDRWAVVYTQNRDSGLLDLSNADQIEKALKPFIAHGTAVPETHNHWACGWVAGYRILVYTKSGKVTKAFRAYCELMQRLDDYPILDEGNYSRREYEATLENIREVGGRLVRNDVPPDWPSLCYEWFDNNIQRAVENRDDQGGYPDEEEMRECLEELGFLDD